MKRIILLLAAAAMPCMALAQTPREPEPYTPEQIREKFGVGVDDGNYAPVVKSILQWMNRAAGDDAMSADVVTESLKEMALRLPEPARGVVNFIVADFYKSYWQGNSWRIRNRTSAPEAGGTLDTWDLKRLFSEAVKYYDLALANAATLQATPTAAYDEVLEYFPTERFSRNVLPTLYDVLTSATILAFEREMSNVMPGQEFVIDDPHLFAPAAAFVQMKIPAPETPSAEYEVLRLFQERLSFRLAEHRADGSERNVVRLVVADIERLKYLRSKGVFENADDLYETSLRWIAGHYENYRQCTIPLLEIVRLYIEQGALWDRGGDGRYKNRYADAWALCDTITESYSWAVNEARALQKEIAAPSLSVTTTSRPYPGEPFLARAKYRNVEQLYIRAYKLNEAEARDIRNNQNWRWLNGREPALEMPAVAIPDYGDYQPHSAQFAIHALPQGHYLLLASDVPFTAGWQINEDVLVTETTIQVTPLTCITRDGGNDIFRMPGNAAMKQVYVTDAKTGKPVAGARIDVNRYDYDSDRDALGYYPELQYGTYHTDDKGIAYITNRGPNSNRTSNLSKIIITSPGGGRLVETNDLYFQGRYRTNRDETPSAVFFTDRAIYRPGQTIYYKALLIGPDPRGGNKAIEGRDMEVRLFDVNGKEVSVQKVTTNDFGSVQGSFTIPQGLLNGMMRLQTQYGQTTIQVEEYKRPTFEVKIDPVKGTYRYGDQVEVTGVAEALAGYSVDNSTVKYRVVRQGGYDPLYRYRSSMPSMTAPREIAVGEVTTAADGKFTIRFTASPEGIRYRDVRSNFTVSVDVTDINGETRSAFASVAVSDNPLRISGDIPYEVSDRKDLKFELTTTNLNGTPVPADVSVTVEELEGPKRILRDGLWESPDTTLIARQEFEHLFPYDIYSDEDDPKTYAIRERVASFTITTTATDKADTLDLRSLARRPAGWYRVTLKAVGEGGTTAEEVHTLRLNSTPSGKPTPIVNVENWIVAQKASGEPGEEAVFLVAAPEKGTTVRYDVFRKGIIAESRTIEAGPTPRKVSFSIGEDDRGGFYVQFIMVHGGRKYSSQRSVGVPFTNKVLDVEFTTFRNQLLPGEHERWSLTVKNKAGEAELAEMVASLYDASLDEFAKLYWPSLQDLLPRTYYNVPYIDTNTPVSNTNYKDYKMYIAPRPATPAIRLNRFGKAYLRLMRNDGHGNTRAAGGILDALSVIDPSYAINEPPPPATGTVLEDVVVNGMLQEEKVSFTGSAVTLGSNSVTFNYDASSASEEFDESLAFNDNPSLLTDIATRQNFNETAFFYPQLRTNEKGEILIEFTVPESLTRWNMLGFAHTKDLKAGSVRNSLITQKQVAVSANAPRFLREGDTIEFTAKVNNITEGDLSGEAMLRLFDAATMQPIESVITTSPTLSFSVEAGQSSGLSWRLVIPEGMQAITYRLTAQAGAHTDGEERTIPVMSNTILVTETMPFMVRAGQTETVDFARLREGAATVKRNQGLTLEFTSNPAWYAVQAMPYLMDYPYDCAEQMFSKFYANSLSAAIVGSTPRIKAIFEQWRDMPEQKNALLSNLEKNQELKQVLLEETPWVVQAGDETERKKRVGLLFDLNQMAAGKRLAFDKLRKMQRGDGGFAWFDGLPPNRYITQHIIAGFSKLSALNVIGEDYAAEVQTIIDNGFRYLDADLLRDYEAAKRSKNFDPAKMYISYIQLHYLYTTSFSGHKPVDAAQLEAFEFYFSQARTFWSKFNIYGKGLAAFALHRYGDTAAAKKVVASLKSMSRTTEDMGMFWRENRRGYFWHEAPIETQALMIAVFDEIAGDADAVNELKIWLLRNKQTNDWQTTKATADACYALLRTGGDLLDESRLLEVTIGGQPLAEVADGEIRPEAGTGYVKTTWAGSDVTPEMGVVKVTNPNRTGIAWGGLYWQYFEQSDKITATETELRMEKQLFIKRNTPRGPELVEIKDGASIKVGDLLTVRLVLRAHRDYEYVHLKDMRASGLEPVRTVSGYRFQDGLGYYENVKDASTNFFITSLRGGTYVFEYDLRVTHAGDFSNGITTFQCMYAPEFSAHSEGVRVRVND